MHLVELWTPTDAWNELAEDRRAAFFESVAAAMAPIEDQATCLGWGEVDPNTDAATQAAYIAVWELPGPDEISEFLSTLRNAGWYQYFNQVNAASHLGPPPETAARMIARST